MRIPEAERRFIDILPAPRVTMGNEEIMLRAIGSAEVDQFVEFVLHIPARRALRWRPKQLPYCRSSTRRVWRLYRHDSPPAVRHHGHVLHDYVGITRDMFAQNVNDRACAQVRRTRRWSAEDHLNGLVLIERRLREAEGCAKLLTTITLSNVFIRLPRSRSCVVLQPVENVYPFATPSAVIVGKPECFDFFSETKLFKTATLQAQSAPRSITLWRAY
jgi:hypothetical protein